MSIKFIITERIINEICEKLAEDDINRGSPDEKTVVSVFMNSMRGHDWSRSKTLEDGSSLSREGTGDLSPTVTLVEKDINEFSRALVDFFRRNKIDRDTPRALKHIFTDLFRFSKDDGVFGKSQFQGLKHPVSPEGHNDFPVRIFVKRDALADSVFSVMETRKVFRPLRKSDCLRIVAENFQAEDKSWVSVINSGHVKSSLEDRSEVVGFWSDGMEAAMDHLSSVMWAVSLADTDLGKICRKMVELIGSSAMNEDDLYLAKLRHDARRATSRKGQEEDVAVMVEAATAPPARSNGVLVQMTDKDLSRIVDRLADTVRARPETSKSSLLNIVAAEVAGPGHDWGLIKRGWPKNAQA